MDKVDIAVIGSGPAGYVAAICAAQKGLRVLCIEKEKTLGGTCLNVGCIPSKALLHSTEYYHRIAHSGKEHGIEGQLSVNLAQMMERKNKIVSGLTSGIAFLFKKNQVIHLQAEARLLSPTLIQAGEKKIEARHILLATGSESIPLPFLPFDEKRVLSSTGALELKEIPKKMLLVGAGVIGLELGSVYKRLGTEVEVVELLERAAPGFDAEIAKHIQQILTKQGFSFRFSTKVTNGKVEGQQVLLTLEDGTTLSADVALVAIGRRPYTENLNLEAIGVKKDQKGRVQIDNNFRTSISNIYAIGDLVDGPMLAHKAFAEAEAVIHLIAGEKASVNYLAIPNVMYTWPEVASVGMTEEEARLANLELIIGKVPFKAIARARCSGDEEGLVKILGEKKSRRLIGLHIIGPNASEMIHEGVLGIEQKMTLDQIASATHAHPSSSEAIKEAALSALGRAIHM